MCWHPNIPLNPHFVSTGSVDEIELNSLLDIAVTHIARDCRPVYRHSSHEGELVKCTRWNICVDDLSIVFLQAPSLGRMRILGKGIRIVIEYDVLVLDDILTEPPPGSIRWRGEPRPNDLAIAYMILNDGHESRKTR